MEDLLRQVEEKIAYCRYWQSALIELEAMAEKLRRMIAAQPHALGTAPNPPVTAGHSPQVKAMPNGKGTPPGSNVDLSAVSIRTAARYILSSSGNQWMNVEDIAKAAVAGGFKSARHGDDVEKVAYYFLDTLRRDRETFERRSKDYRLVPGAESLELVKKNTKPGEKPLADRVAEVMERIGSPMRIQDIIDEIEKTDYVAPNRPGAFYAAIYSVLDRTNGRFERVDKGLWRLENRGNATNNTPIAASSGK